MSKYIVAAKNNQEELQTGLRDAELLRELVNSCGLSGVVRHGCLLNLSILIDDSKRIGESRADYLDGVRATLAPLLEFSGTQLFTMPNRDWVVIWRKIFPEVLAQVKDAMEVLFADGEIMPQSGDLIWEEIELPADGARLIDILEQKSPEAIKAEVVKHELDADLATPLLPLDLDSLMKLEVQLARADVAHLVRRSQVYQRLRTGLFRESWERRLLNLAEIADTMLPGYGLDMNVWLYHRLTRTLDRRMLALLASLGELADASPFSISLSVTSILSPDFLRFDAALPFDLRGSVRLDVSPTCLIADPISFQFACDFVRERGYTLVLHAVTIETLMVFLPKLSGVDLVALHWSEALLELELKAMGAEPGRLVLVNVTNPAAIEWGVAQGIRFYAGPAVDAAHHDAVIQ